MKKFETIEVKIDQKVATVWLNRPQIHNAFNEIMIEELSWVFTELGSSQNVRVIVLRGKGPSFCAGADLNWMRDVSQYSYDQNLAESLNLSECFHRIYSCPKPTIAVVHGAAIGGANGLLSACDIVIATEQSKFSLSEVKIGIVPACISPYVIKRVGEFTARELMLTGMRFDGQRAEHMGLVNRSISEGEVENTLQTYQDGFKTSGPEAIAQCKVLIDKVVNTLSLEEAKTYTAEMIAAIRASAEGQEGMKAFLEKRKPRWIDD